MRTIVTGGSGRVGSAVVKQLAEAGHAVVNIDVVPPRHDVPGATYVRGSIQDAELVASTVQDADAVVHLAAIPRPGIRTDHDVFVNNCTATFTLLDSAARAGVRRAIVASSISVLGLAWAPRPLEPPTMPVREDAALQVTDAYALSKQVDEATAQMMARRWGIDVLCYRLPDMGDSQHLLARGRAVRCDPGTARRELWAYLHVDDAARAVLLGLDANVKGAVVINVVAGDPLGGIDVEQCARDWFADPSFREPIPSGRCAYDTSRAESLLGFASRIRWDAADPELANPPVAG